MVHPVLLPMDVWIPPALSLGLAAALPFASTKGLAWAYLHALPDDAAERAARLQPFRRGATAAALAQIAVAAVAGFHSLSPSMVDARTAPACFAFGALCGLVSAAAALLSWRRALPDGRGLPAREVARRVLGRGGTRGGGGAIGVFYAIVLVAGYATARAVSDVSVDAIRSTSPTQARLRLLVEPWDGEAMLALGWHARQVGDLSAAGDLVDAAAARNADAESTFLLRAEVAAARGDCEAARDAFEASLRAQAERAMNADAPLRLGGYDLPPTMVTDCEFEVGDVF